MPKRQRLSEAQKTKLYEGHLALATDMGSRFARTMGIPIAEAVEEAKRELGHIVACWSVPGAEGYDPSQCSPTSWIYRGLYWSLKTTYTRRRSREMQFGAMGKEENPIDFPARSNWVRELIATMGEDARILVNTIVYAPAEIIEDMAPQTHGRARKAVKAYLKQQGWDSQRLAAAWSEVEVCLT